MLVSTVLLDIASLYVVQMVSPFPFTCRLILFNFSDLFRAVNGTVPKDFAVPFRYFLNINALFIIYKLNHHHHSHAQMELLWLCLAAMAVHYKQLDAAQVAFAALKQTDKILYIDAIKVESIKKKINYVKMT